MFKKLVSNLPFNPSLISQVSFYSKRLHKEESIRRLGTIFTVLAMMIQMIAVISPAKATFAGSENDIVYNGFSSAESLAQTYDSGCDSLNRCDIKTIYAKFGITDSSMIRAGRITKISGTDPSYLTHGRSLTSKGGNFIPVPGIVNEGIYERKLSVWSERSWDALEVNGSQGTVWILLDCGNPTVKPGSSSPTPQGSPSLSIKKQAIPQSGSNVKRGDTILYQLLYTNSGDAAATEVEIFDALPVQVEFLNVVQAGATLVPNGNSLNFYFGPNKANSQLSTGIQDHLISFNTRVRADAPEGQFCNSGLISSTTTGASASSPVCHTVVVDTVQPLPANYSAQVVATCEGDTSVITVIGNGIRNIDQVIDNTYPEPFGYNGTLPSVYRIKGVHSFSVSVGLLDGSIKGPFVFTTTGCVVNPPPVVPPVVVVEMCPLDNTIPKSDTARCKVCPHNSLLIIGNPACKPPVTPDPPKPCQYNPALKPDDAKCKPTCQYDPTLLTGDPGCVEAITECTLLESPQFLNRIKVRFTVKGRVAGNAKITAFSFSPGDDSKLQTINTAAPVNGVYTSTIEHTYPEAGERTYKASMIALTSIGERVTSTCQQTVVIEKDKSPIISTSKSVRNATQNIANANGTTANPGDELIYTIRAQNVGDATQKAYIFPDDSIQDVLDYADLTDKKSAELINKSGLQTLVWKEPVDVPTGQSVEKQFVVKVKSSLPKTNTPSSDPLKYDCQIDNTIGNVTSSKDTVVVKFNAALCKPVEQVVKTLPNTGPGASMMMTFLGVLVVMFFYSRSRLLAKEVDVVRYEFGMKGI